MQSQACWRCCCCSPRRSRFLRSCCSAKQSCRTIWEIAADLTHLRIRRQDWCLVCFSLQMAPSFLLRQRKSVLACWLCSVAAGAPAGGTGGPTYAASIRLASRRSLSGPTCPLRRLGFADQTRLLWDYCLGLVQVGSDCSVFRSGCAQIASCRRFGCSRAGTAARCSSLPRFECLVGSMAPRSADASWLSCWTRLLQGSSYNIIFPKLLSS